jgi:membrane protease YdiL (CAAX protease family)
MHLVGSAVLLAGALTILGLLTGPFEYRLFRMDLGTRSKLSVYAGLALLLWILTAAAVGISGWSLLIHSPATTGPWLPGPGIGGVRIAGVAISVATAVYVFLALQPLIGSLRGVRRRRAYAAALRRHGAAFPGFLPNTAPECAAFALVSLTAGICEEVLFRGFLIRFLHESSLNLSLVAALAASSLIFGSNHAYQGVKGVAATAIAGLALGSVFLVTGQLLPGIVLHALIDLQVAYVLLPITERDTATELATPG